jgi:hypothetical protein
LIEGKEESNSIGWQTRAASSIKPDLTLCLLYQELFRFQQKLHIEDLIKHKGLGDCDASADSAFTVIMETLPDGNNLHPTS